MANEVEIVVVTKDKTDFNAIGSKAKAETNKVGKDIEHSITGAVSGIGAKVGQEGIKAGANFGASLANSAESMLSSTGPGGAAVTGALVGVGVAAAPLLGALLSGAVIGGAGIGGVVGGLMLVKDDPAVSAAASSVGKSIMDDLKIDAKPFVEPAIKGLDIIRRSFASANGDIQSIFSKSATFVQPLAQAVGDVIPKITSGINSLVQGAGPVISALSEGIEMVGDAIGDGFKSLSDDGVAAGVAIEGTFNLITAAVKVTFAAVDALTKTFGWFAKHGLLGPGIETQFEALQSGASKSADSLDDIASSADDATSALHGLSDALKAQTDPAFALIDAQSQLSEAQANYNDALAQHGKNSSEAAKASEDLAKAALGVESATENAGDALNGTMTPALRATLRAAGLTEAQIDSIGRQFDTSAAKGRNFAKNYKAKVQLEGVDNVKRMAAEAKAFISSIPSVKTTTIRTVYLQIGKPFSTSAGATGIGGGNFTGHAAGGVVGAAANGGPQSNLTLVGEQGPELVNLAPGSMVTPAGQTASMLAGMNSGGGGQVSTTINFTGNTDTAFATAFQKMLNAGQITINSKFVR